MLRTKSPRIVLKRLHFNENIVKNFLQEVENKSSAILMPGGLCKEEVKTSKISKRKSPRVVLERLRFDENLRQDDQKFSITPKPDILCKEKVQTSELSKHKIPVVMLERIKFEENMIVDLLDDDDQESTTIKSATVCKEKVHVSKTSKGKIPIVVLERMKLNKTEEKKKEIEKANSETPRIALKRIFEENDELYVKKKKKIESPSKKVPRGVLQGLDHKETRVTNLTEVEKVGTEESLVTLTEKCDEPCYYVFEIIEEPHLTFCKTCSVFYSNAVDHFVASPDCKDNEDVYCIDLISNEQSDVDENVHDVDLDPLSEFNKPEQHPGEVIDLTEDVCDPANDDVQMINVHLGSMPKDDSDEVHPVEDDVELNSLSEVRKTIQSENQTYICEVCNISFQRAKEIKEHLRGHALFITLCDRRSKLFRHVGDNVKTIYLPFSCTVCSKSFSCLNYLKRHNKLHSEEISSSCQASNTQLNNPQLKATPYPSTVGYTSLSSLKGLKANHFTKKPFKCNTCKRSYVKEISLLNHVCRGTFVCKLCNKSFFIRTKLMQHYKIIHLDAKLYPCDKCDKKFSCSDYLNRHRSVHLEKTIACDLCNKLFACARYLKCHMLTHAKKNNITNIINNRFKAISNLDNLELDSSDNSFIVIE